MKKMMSLLMALVMVTALLAGCSNGDKDGGAGSGAGDVSALDALTAIWDKYAEADRFASFGGGSDAPVQNAPGEFPIADAELVDNTLGLPADQIENIDGAASLIHMMNANTFTAAAYHVKSGADAKAIGEAISEHLKDRQWMCGFPEKLLVMTVGENTLVTVFGAGDLTANFLTAAKEAYSDVTVVVDQSLAF